MDKRIRKLNNTFARINFWNGLKLHLDSFVKVIDEQPYLTSGDRINLHEIHYMLHLCRNMAEYQEDYHRQKFKEVFNGSLFNNTLFSCCRHGV